MDGNEPTEDRLDPDLATAARARVVVGGGAVAATVVVAPGATMVTAPAGERGGLVF